MRVWSSWPFIPKFRRVRIVPSMFPFGQSATDPTDNEQDIGLGEEHENGGDVNSEIGFQPTENPEIPEEVFDHPSECCMRIVPHDQNTGAFFIVILHKLSPLPAIQEKPINLQRNMYSNNEECCEKLSNEVIESPNVDQVDDADVKFPEAASDTDLVEVEPNEVASEHDLCQPCEENKLEEVPGDRENVSKKVV